MITLDLPFPPSVNSIWRAYRKKNGKPGFILSAKYVTWKKEAEAMVMASGVLRGHVTITAAVEAVILLDRARKRGDTDNRIKVVLDFLERMTVVKNDKQAERVIIEWGDVPSGCRVTVTKLEQGKAG